MDNPEISQPSSQNKVLELGSCLFGAFIIVAFNVALLTMPRALLIFIPMVVIGCIERIPLFIKLSVFAAAVALGFLSKPSSYTTDERIGNIAEDGRRSDAISSGAASHHGGVKNWIYAEELLNYRHYIIWHFFLTLFPLILSGYAISEKISQKKKQSEQAVDGNPH